MLRSSFSVGRRASCVRPGRMCSTSESRPGPLLVEIGDLGGVPMSHDRAVVDVGVVGRPGHDQAVDEGHGHAHLDAGFAGVAEQSAGRRAVQIDTCPCGHRPGARPPGNPWSVWQADVADDALVQDGVDRGAVIEAPDGRTGAAWSVPKPVQTRSSSSWATIPSVCLRSETHGLDTSQGVREVIDPRGPTIHQQATLRNKAETTLVSLKATLLPTDDTNSRRGRGGGRPMNLAAVSDAGSVGRCRRTHGHKSR